MILIIWAIFVVLEASNTNSTKQLCTNRLGQYLQVTTTNDTSLDLSIGSKNLCELGWWSHDNGGTFLETW